MRELIGRSEESATSSRGTRERDPASRQTRPRPAAASGEVLALQSTVGNRAVTGLLERQDAARYGGWEQAGIGVPAQTRLEASFGEDFSGVVIRTDLDPRTAPYGARACVEGRVIRVDPRLANRGDETIRVVGHELAHIVQGRRGVIRADTFDQPVGPTRADAGSDHAARVRFDEEAELAGDRVTCGQAAPIRAGSVVPQTQTLDWPSLDEVAESSLLTVTLGPVLGPIVAATSDEKDRKEFLDKSKKAVGDVIDDLEDRATEQDEKLTSQVGDTPVLGTLVRANAKVAKFQREVTGGFLKAGSETLLGLAGLTLTPVESAKGIAELGHTVNQFSAASTVTDIAVDVMTGTPVGEATTNAVTRRGETAVKLVDAFTEGYQEAWREGRYGQIPGRLAFEAVSLLIPGDEAGKLGQAAKLGGKSKLLGKADELVDLGTVVGKGKTPPRKVPAAKPKPPAAKSKPPATKPKPPAAKPKPPAAKPKPPAAKPKPPGTKPKPPGTKPKPPGTKPKPPATKPKPPAKQPAPGKPRAPAPKDKGSAAPSEAAPSKKPQSEKGQESPAALSPEQAAGFTKEQAAQAGRVLGQPMTTPATQRLARIWDDVANPSDAAKLNKGNSRRLFNNHRNRFWRAVRRDPIAMRIFEDMGAVFPKGKTSAPVVTFKDGRRTRITIDHIVERQTNPGRAVDPSNLRFSFTRENTVLLRLIHALDPFQ